MSPPSISSRAINQSHLMQHATYMPAGRRHPVELFPAWIFDDAPKMMWLRRFHGLSHWPTPLGCWWGRWDGSSHSSLVVQQQNGVGWVESKGLRACKTEIQRAPIWTTSPSQTIFPSNHPFKNSMTEDNLQGETDLRSTGEGSLLQRQGVDF